MSNGKRPIGLIIAMDKELAPLVEGRSYRTEARRGTEFYLFDVADNRCVAVKSGIGKVNAAYAATTLIYEYEPEYVINTGISGGLGRNGLLDLVVAEKTVQYDVDTTALGDPIGLVSTVNKIYFESDGALVSAFANICGAKKEILACGDRFVADEKTKNFIVETFNAGACDMESAAIAQVAFLTNTPFVAIRCISDGGGEGAETDYNKMTDTASEKLAGAVLKVLGYIVCE